MTLRLKMVVANPTARSDGAPATYIALEHVQALEGRLVQGVQPPVEERTDAVLARPDDVLFGKLRPYLAKVLHLQQDATCSGELLVLRANRELMDPRFLYYLCLSKPFVSWAMATSEGVKMPRTDFASLAEFPLDDLPPLTDQRRIAQALDARCRLVDELLTEQDELIRLADERAEAGQAALALRGLDGDRPLVDTGHAWMGQVPAHWSVARLKYEARLESGHTPARSRPELWQACTIPWISLNDVGAMRGSEYIDETVNLISEEGIAASSARLLPAGTVVLSRDATIGRCAIMARPMATSQHFADWVCGPHVEPRYLWLLFATAMQPYFDSLTDGATLRTIGMGDLRNFIVPLPPLDEQRQVVEAAAALRERTNALKTALVRQIELLREHKQALISDDVAPTLRMGQ